MEWIIALASGAVGGNLAGGVLKKLSLGTIGNSIAGLLGGAGGMQLMGMLGGAATTGDAASGIDIGSLISQVAAGGAGGGVAMAVIGQIKKLMGR